MSEAPQSQSSIFIIHHLLEMGAGAGTKINKIVTPIPYLQCNYCNIHTPYLIIKSN